MTRLEEYKHKRKSALIVVCTLGLAGLAPFGGFGGTWQSNVFRDTSVSQSNDSFLGFRVACSSE